MTRPTDEILMAYADDALDPVEMAKVGAYLAGDAEARALVETYRRTAALARDAFSEPLRSPPPKALLDAILKQPGIADATGPARAGTSDGNQIVDLNLRRQSGRSISTFRLPLAASLALLVGLGGGYLIGGAGGDQSRDKISLGAVSKAAPLADLLEHRPFGSTAGRYALVATFRDKHDRACREFELLRKVQSNSPEVAAVACRGRDGTWLVEGAARIAGAAPAGTGIEPSGAVERDALDGLLNMLGAKPVLTAAEEQALIEANWK